MSSFSFSGSWKMGIVIKKKQKTGFVTRACDEDSYIEDDNS